MEEIAIGKVVKFFSKIGVAAISVTSGELKVGDTIKIKGHLTDFEQQVESMQVEHASVEVVAAGKDVGIKVKEAVRENDTVYVVRP
jgi:translation initiation factor IF-2